MSRMTNIFILGMVSLSLPLMGCDGGTESTAPVTSSAEEGEAEDVEVEAEDDVGVEEREPKSEWNWRDAWDPAEPSFAA